MIDKIVKELSGKKLSDLYGVFFFEAEHSFEDILSIYIPNKDNNFIGLSPDGNSKAKLINIFSDIYFAEEIGFTIIAPLLKFLNPKGVDNSTISKASLTQKIETVTNNDGSKLKFEIDIISIETISKDIIELKFICDDLDIICRKLE